MENEVRLPDNWSDWKITNLVGAGSYGAVYRAEKQLDGQTYVCAIKIINIPKNDAERKTCQKQLHLDEKEVVTRRLKISDYRRFAAN